MIDREQILGLVPHAGSMCLIERVLQWDQDAVRCESDNHGDAEHPLRRRGALAALHLIEYGAQAAAVHGALLARDASRHRQPGVLVSVRDCELFVEQLQDIPGPLDIRARRELSRPDALIYAFEIGVGERRLARGRIAIMLTESDRPFDTSPR